MLITIIPPCVNKSALCYINSSDYYSDTSYTLCVFFYIKLLKLNSGIPPHATVCVCVCVMEQGPRCHFLCDPPGTSFFIVHYQLLFPSPFPQSSSVEFVPFNRKCRFHGNQFNLLFLQMKLVLSLWKVFFFFVFSRFLSEPYNHA